MDLGCWRRDIAQWGEKQRGEKSNYFARRYFYRRGKMHRVNKGEYGVI